MTAPAGTGVSRRRSLLRLTLAQRRTLWAYLALGIPILFFAAIRIGPTLYAFNLGFREWDILSPEKPWVGLANYVRLFQDEVFRRSLLNTAVYVLAGVPAQLALGLGAALLIHRVNRFQGFFRVLYFIPYITSTVAVAWVFRWMLMKNGGVVNEILRFFGCAQVNFLGDPDIAIFSVMGLAAWQGMGFAMLIFLAGLESIPKMFYEAGQIDGANRWHLFRHITLPLLNPTIVFLAVIGGIRYLQIFTEVVNMSSQGQGGPLNSTKSLVLFIYQEAFKSFKMGYASATTVVLFVIIMVLTMLQMKFLQRRIEY